MPPKDPYADLPEADPYASLPDAGAGTPAGKYDQYLDSGKPKMMTRPPMAEDTLTKVGRGAALGGAEGLGVNLSTNPRDLIEGTFKNLGKGVKDLLVSTWEANAPTTSIGKAAETPLARAAAGGMSPQVVRTGLDIIPTFIDQTATALEQGGKDFYKAIQNKDWESAAQIAAKNSAMIATLKAAKEKGAPAADAVADVAKPTIPERVQGFGRRVTGATYGAKKAVTQAIADQTEALAKNNQARIDTIAKNREITGKALQDIDQQKIDLANQNQQIIAQNAEQAQSVARRGQMAKEVDQESVGVGKDINDLENKVYKQANANFDNVRAKIGNVEAPPDQLISTVKNVEHNVLQDIPENVKEFRSILRLENTSEEMATQRSQVMAGQGMQGSYEDLPPERKAVVDDIIERFGTPVPASIPLTWDKLQSLKSRLDARLRNGRGLNGDLKRSLFAVRNSVVDEMGQMATANGAGSDWAQARDFWRQWREDFHEATGPSGSGSPVAKAKDAVDPDKIRKPFASTQSEIGNRGVNILNRYPQFGGDQIGNRVTSLLSKEQAMNALPKAVDATPLKPPIEAFPMPKRTPLPMIPEKPTVDIQQIARDKIAQRAEQLGHLNAWDARIVAGSVMSAVFAPFIGLEHGVEVGASVIAVKEALTSALNKPKVIEWLAKTPPAELDALNKLPGIDKVNVQHGLTEAAIELSKRRKFALSPELKQFLGPANVARIAAVNSGVQQERKKPGEQLKDLHAIQNRSSNPAMPIGQPE